MNRDPKYVRHVVATHIGGSIVLPVKKYFADPPCHWDVGLVGQKHPNQYSHTRKLKQRHSASGRENKRVTPYYNELKLEYENPLTFPGTGPPIKLACHLSKFRCKIRNHHFSSELPIRICK
jgi:hypothetical protein